MFPPPPTHPLSGDVPLTIIRTPVPGSLTTGKGNRYVTPSAPLLAAPFPTIFPALAYPSPRPVSFVLANTEVLHDKITVLSNRVRALEDALQDVYSQLADEPHPLLTEELRALKRPLERESAEEQEQHEQEQDVVESINVGSL